MAWRVSIPPICVMVVAAAGNATAMELDTLLPKDIPGYGGAPIISVLDRPQPEYNPLGMNFGGVLFNPDIAAGAGYDSRPNGAGAGSAVLDFTPSMTALDQELGLGAYVSGTYTDYPSATAQNLSGYTIALGEQALLPRHTLDLAAALVGTQETGFGLNTVNISEPIDTTIKMLRGGDSISVGMFVLKPEFSFTHYGFTNFTDQNRTDYRESLTTEFVPGGPVRIVSLLHATESEYRLSAFSANTYSALIGISDEATGLWNFRLLGGAAWRRPAVGGSLAVPVLEASVSWMPTDLDSLELDAAREIDDPDQESATGYTLSEMKLSLAHEYLRNVIITGSFDFSRASFIASPLIESLYAATAAINWHLNRALVVNANYAFNDRQANFLNAANQHVFTLGFTWSP